MSDNFIELNFHREVSKEGMQELQEAAEKVENQQLTKSEYALIRDRVINESPVIPWEAEGESNE